MTVGDRTSVSRRVHKATFAAEPAVRRGRKGPVAPCCSIAEFTESAAQFLLSCWSSFIGLSQIQHQ